ncbi:MAG: response regulator [Deltaproteobacteria bacterium]|nr:response regulator [Deltaproteobacteria bacterium]MBW2661364.1 response regulator [Deltaproteobacteria bacterium]
MTQNQKKSAPQKPINILIVDDDDGMTQTLNYILTEKGYEVETAKDGFSALSRIKEKTFDIILTDIRMQGMNGVELLKEINKLFPGTTTVMMTAYTLPELVKEAKREGALVVFPKPLDLDNLIVSIKELTNKKSILILDDDIDFCKSFQGLLNEQGYSTTFTTEVDEAINLVLEAKYSTIFLDMKLNGTTGLDALIAIKKVDPEVVVALITAYRQEMAGLVAESLKRSAYTCLYKPLDIDKLLRLLKEIERKRLKGIL